MNRKAVYAGTFDPPTCGHQWMIEQAARMFDTLVVAIGVNPDKRTMFSLDQRLEMLRSIAEPLPNVRVASFVNQYLIDYAVSVGAGFIVRGIRNAGDFEYERAMRNINGDISRDVATVFLMPPREIAEVSSSVVKGLVGPRGWERMASRYVSTPVLQRLLESKHPVWQHLVALGACGDEKQFWSELWAPYFDERRAYHNWQHICDVLGELEGIRQFLNDPTAVETAIWFHDVVYDSHASDNEQRSADAATAVLNRLGLPESFSRRVSDLILATKHDAVPTDSDARYLIDMDLAILGRPVEEYDTYEAGIRTEYAWVPEVLFAEKRAEVLRGFVDRPQVYATEVFRERYEQTARANLNRAIKALLGQ
jgi:pantetheine-phosphate adenylyltransferase